MKPIKKLISKTACLLMESFLCRNSLCTSQIGQDYWIYGEAFNEKKNGYFVDIGAHNGIDISNTFILESRYSWDGLCIEANPITYAMLKKNRKATCLNICLDKSVGEVNFILKDAVGGIVDFDVDNKATSLVNDKIIKLNTTPLTSVLDSHSAPKIIDYLSIDVEGAEERILSGVDLKKYSFRTITIERPTNHLREHLNDYGYILLKDIPKLDCFYVHQDFINEYMDNLNLFYSKKHLFIRWK